MNITNKTVLITGGGSGIGFSIAKTLSEKNNKVIITGRSEARLKEAVAKLNNANYFVADVTKEDDVNKLVNYLNEKHPTLDILINNAGQAYVYQLSEQSAFEKANDEILTNYLSVIRLTDKLLPGLKKQTESAVVNVTSIVAIAPGKNLPTYSASKAALHSYTQALRLTLAGTSVKVFELYPPLVNTEFSTEIGGENGIPPQQVADELLQAFDIDSFDVRVGFTAQFWEAHLKSPEEALKALNAGR